MRDEDQSVRSLVPQPTRCSPGEKAEKLQEQRGLELRETGCSPRLHDDGKPLNTKAHLPTATGNTHLRDGWGDLMGRSL